MSPRPEDLAAMDAPSTRVAEDSAEWVAKIRAILAHFDLHTAGPQRTGIRAELAPATARSGWDAAAAGSGRTGATSPVDPGPAA